MYSAVTESISTSTCIKIYTITNFTKTNKYNCKYCIFFYGKIKKNTNKNLIYFYKKYKILTI